MAHLSDETKATSTNYADYSSPGAETLKPVLIGTGHSIGISRVPDLELSKSPTVVASSLQNLVSKVNRLEDEGRFVVGAGEDLREGGFASDGTVAEWGFILAQYRQLTMAVTASSSRAMRILAIPVYEGAADASLLGGNLGFYLSCQTRLIRELYKETDECQLPISRRLQFVSYSFLYFGVFQVDRCELARMMRNMSKDVFVNPRVRLALAAIKAVQNRDGIQFISIYKKSDHRQRTLMNSKLSSMRASALAQMICAYRALERKYVLSRLGLAAEAEFLKLLKTQNPELLEQNSLSDSEFRFRLPAGTPKVIK